MLPSELQPAAAASATTMASSLPMRAPESKPGTSPDATQVDAIVDVGASARARLSAIDDRPPPTYQVSLMGAAARPGSMVTVSSRVLPQEQTARSLRRPGA